MKNPIRNLSLAAGVAALVAASVVAQTAPSSPAPRAGAPAAAAPAAPAAPAVGVKTGAAAPDFSLPGADGKTYKLSDFKDKIVVIEWLNHDCPINAKHYEGGETANLPQLQKLAKEKGVVWLSIISSAPGQQGYQDAAGATKEIEKYKASPTAVLLDPSGKVGKLYDAKTTPHMYVIGKDGKLLYQGGIDSANPRTAADIAKSEPYLKNAMLLVIEGKPIPAEKATTAPYGCTVKYGT